jgi:hypothetical protein
MRADRVEAENVCSRCRGEQTFSGYCCSKMMGYTLRFFM